MDRKRKILPKQDPVTLFFLFCFFVFGKSRKTKLLHDGLTDRAEEGASTRIYADGYV